MKRFFYIFASLLILAGCSDRLGVVDNQLVPDGEMIVNLKVDGPMAKPGTRSYVSGTETAIESIKMLCFDAGGSYISSRDATLTPSGDFSGQLTGTVPANTARIHFLANFDKDLSSITLGSPEKSVMKSDLLSSGINDDVRYWGYHKESSASIMSTYLTGGNTVTLIRDRAKVSVINQDPEITSIQWTISNGLKKGFLAAVSSDDNNNPYDNNYTSSTVLTEYRSSGEYTLTEATAAWTSAGTAVENAQFLFENSNSTNPVKIIVKATYNGGATRYHTILLQDSDKKQYRIFRNESFVLTIKQLPNVEVIGSDNFDDAASTENYSNNPFAQVAREVNEVNDETYRFAVEEVVQVYDSGTTGTVNFTFTKHDGTSTGKTKDDFEASWEPKADDDESPDVTSVTTAPTVNYDPATGKGTVTFSLNTITSDLKFNTLQIVSPSGLTRYVDVYSVSAFQYATAPTLVDNGTKREVGDVDREVYKLTFALPDNVPENVYPLTIRMYTSTLIPFSDAASSPSAPHGSFNIVAGPTGLVTPTPAPAPSDWNFGASDWGYWYEYEIPAPGSYTFYFTERCADYYPGKIMQTVGLYFDIDDFGEMKALSAAAPQPSQKTVTFNASDFDVDSDDHAESTKSGVTVVLDNADEGNGYITMGYRSWGTNYDGEMTVSGIQISRIVLNYSTYYGQVSSNPSGYTRSDTTGTWTGNASQVEFSMGRANNQFARVSSIQVTYIGY